MDVVFFGSGAFGIPTLRALAQTHRVVGIVTQPDKPAGRKKILTPTPIGQWAAEHLPGVPIAKPERINTDEARALVHAWDADAWVIIAYGQYLGQKLLGDRFAINLHASRLPRWRGAAPINAAIVAGDTITGNSVITIAKEMDAGAVLAQSSRPIEPDQTAGELHDLLADEGPALVLRVLDDHAHNRVQFTEQDESLVTIAAKMTKDDGRVRFDQPASVVRCAINGLSPWPGATSTHRDAVLKLNRAEPSDIISQEAPGTIVDASEGIVSCANAGCLRLLEVQPAGKRAMPWKDYANGRRVESGEVLEGRTEP